MGPYDIILGAFTYFKAQTIDEDGLVNVALAANCPSRDVALRLLKKMVDEGFLLKQTQGGKNVYSIVPGGPAAGSGAKH
jgi:predicted transcriptional regulator